MPRDCPWKEVPGWGFRSDVTTSPWQVAAERHSGELRAVCVDVTLERVHVAVGDDNSRPPRLQPQDAEALDGRGLQILEIAASRWGVNEDGLGKVVWFEVDRHRSATA